MTMDKKKVKELIQEAKHLAILRKYENRQTYLNNCICRLEEALKELNKPDWVSVEDELPPYNENVEVCSKVKPTEVWTDSRDKYINVGNSFRYNKLYGNIITHWKPIEKLEE